MVDAILKVNPFIVILSRRNSFGKKHESVHISLKHTRVARGI